MQKLSLHPGNGTVVFQSQRPTTFVRAQPLSGVNPSLSKIDRLRGGAAPRIAIIRSQGGIGDIVMTIPAVRAISEKYGAPITYGTDFSYLDGALPAVLRDLPYIKEVVPYQEIESHPELFDATINLTCPCILHEKPGAPPISRIDLFARHAGIPLANKNIDYVLAPSEIHEARNLLQQLGYQTHHKLILLGASSSTDRRDIPREVVTGILRNLSTIHRDARILAVTHSSDAANPNPIIWGDYSGVTEVRGLKVRSLTALMSLCHLVVCPDSALLHLAGAINKPSLSFFGPTDPRARINYYSGAVAIWGGAELQCSPCWYESCRQGHLCWKRIEIPLVLQVLSALLNNLPLPTSPDVVTFPSALISQSFDVL